MDRIPALVNCTGTPVFVLVEGRLVRLPEALSPQVLELSRNAPGRAMVVQVAGAVVELVGIDLACPVVSTPPALDGVLYLVSAETFAQFPGRADFVRPALYRHLELETLEHDPADSGALEAAQIRRGTVAVLTALTRSSRVADPDAEELRDLEVVEPGCG